HDVSVHLRHEHLAVCNCDAARLWPAAQVAIFQMRDVGPFQSAGYCVIGLYGVASGFNIHDAVDDEWRRFHRISDSGLDEGGRSQQVDIADIDLFEWGEALIVVSSTMQTPVVDV